MLGETSGVLRLRHKSSRLKSWQGRGGRDTTGSVPEFFTEGVLLPEKSLF